MSCGHPLRGWRSKFPNKNGKFPVVFSPGLDATEKVDLPCGQCFGCRLDKAKAWAARCVHEASLYEDNCFITLTYADDKVPADGSLQKSHFVKFMKRLRRRYPNQKIRYYMCGEYGDELSRPHYHALLFNFDFEDRVLWKEDEENSLFISEELDRIWTHGFCWIGAVTFESAAYCARYCLKLITGERAEDHYLRCDEYGVAYWLEPEYCTMSRGGKNGHGLGYDWFKRFTSDCFPCDELPIPGRGVFGRPPKYYLDIWETEADPEEWRRVKETRRQYFWDHFAEGDKGRLESIEKYKKAQVGLKRRSYENAY